MHNRNLEKEIIYLVKKHIYKTLRIERDRRESAVTGAFY